MKRIVIAIALLFIACPMPKPEPIVPMPVKRFEFCGFEGGAMQVKPVHVSRTADKVYVVYWNPNIENDLAGYRVYWGKSDVREHVQDVGLTTEKVFSLMTDGDYMTAVTAYDTAGNESPLSEIVKFEDMPPEVPVDSLVDDFNSGQYPNPEKWVVANNSIDSIKNVDGVVRFNSKDFVSAWMRSKNVMPLAGHVVKVLITKSSNDFALGLSSSYEMNTPFGFFGGPVIRFYVASVADSNKRGLYYVERQANQTLKEKLLVADARFKNSSFGWRIGFTGEDSVRWEYCFDGESEWREIYNDRHMFSNVDKLWIELAAYDTKRKGVPAVGEFAWRSVKAVESSPVPVDTSLIKIPANAKTICLNFEPDFRDTASVPFDSIGIKILVNYRELAEISYFYVDTLSRKSFSASVALLRESGEDTLLFMAQQVNLRRNVESQAVVLAKRFVF